MTEQRDSERTELDATVAVVDVESGVEFSGAGRDVSSSGISFHAELEPPVGADMLVTMKGKKSMMHVTRVERAANGFDVSGRLSSR
ncbi:MAG: PilZ domain-containing protein [Archangium sp.]